MFDVEPILNWFAALDWSKIGADLVVIGLKSLVFAFLPTMIAILFFRRWRKIRSLPLSVYLLYREDWTGGKELPRMELLHKTTIGEAFEGKVRETARSLLAVAKRNKRVNASRELLEFTPQEMQSIGPRLLREVKERFALLRLRQCVGDASVNDYPFDAFVRVAAPPEDLASSKEVQVLLTSADLGDSSSEYVQNDVQAEASKLMKRAIVARDESARRLQLRLPVAVAS